MTDIPSNDDPVDDLAEEFARRWRDGERPSVDDYVARYPQWADEIRTVLPAVLLMEQMKPQREETLTASSATRSAEPLPERLGEYRIVREIGRGGMGVVYEAEQMELGRRVALKVLPRHLLRNEKLRTRFRHEARAAARLHHTNIVPVFGVGEADDYCFYAMQLIEGRGLDQVIRSAAISQTPVPAGVDPGGTDPGARSSERAANGPADKHDPTFVDELLRPADHPHEAKQQGLASSAFCRTAAQLGVQVADALAYAHAQGILHRDIKPSNLLLDEQGKVWVTDFGVAKLIEEANLTQSGEFAGTLRYMAPERFAGQSDPRGDVYSLGVTLYELLTLRPAFPDNTPQHLIQQITQTAPIRPRKLNRHIPADLETIVLKAAAPDPALRYQTPGEVADDLRRFLDDRPILAQRAGLLQRAWRWCRRNPALACATAAAFVLMLAVTVVSLVGYARTDAANRQTATANSKLEKALAAEKAQRQHAEDVSTQALGALNRMYDRFALTPLIVAPQAPDERMGEIPQQPVLPPEAVALMEDLLRTYQQVARSAAEFPSLQAQAAEANFRIGDICQRLARFQDAAAAYQNAIDLYAQPPDDTTGDALRLKLARACNELGRTLRALRQYDDARSLHERAIRTLTTASKAFSERPACRYELARSYYTLGERDMSLFRPGLGLDPPPGRPPPPVADHPIRQAASLLERLLREFPSAAEYRHLLACCYRDMPPSSPRDGPPPSNANLDRAVELLEKLVADFPKVPDYRSDLCETLGRPTPPPRNGDVDGAARTRKRLEKAIALGEELASQYANVPEYTAAHARYLGVLGTRLLEAQQFDEAEKRLQTAVALANKLVKQYPDVIAYAYWLSLIERSLARLESERGAWPKARRQLESAATRMEAVRQKEPNLPAIRTFLGLTYRDLAMALDRSGETALAAETRRKAEQFGTNQPGPGPSGPKRERRGKGK